ncbi:MAG: serine--tRNA ligase [Chlamydiales bacterium]|nr:serine--tRNA ligase [Chlamydiales bacterium]
MLDIKLIRKDRKSVEEKLKRKEPDLDLGNVLELDDRLRHLITEAEHLKAERNEKSKLVGEKKRKGESAEELMEEVRQIGEKISSMDAEQKELEEAFTDALSRIPNIPMDDVKNSQDKDENEVIKIVGELPQFSFEPKHHLELNEKLNLFDFHRTAKTSGAGWPAYRGMGARLEWALLNYMIEIQILNGFEFWLPPLMVRPPIMFGSGQIPKFEGQFYEIRDEEHPLFLVPTSEVVLNGLHYDEIIPEEDLPIKYAAFTPCFRREAGAAGAQERGLIRVHQFHKIEMFCFTTPEQSEEVLEQMIGVAEEILKGLGLHYRLTKLVTGDMSFTAAKTIDIEVWLPGQKRYYEVSSLSTCTDYQARRSHIRYRPKGGKPELVHTLNGSGLAMPRLMVALLENNQKADGSVTLPPVLAEKLGTHELK